MATTLMSEDNRHLFTCAGLGFNFHYFVDSKNQPYQTICTVTDLATGNKAESHAVSHPNDRIVKKIGRKLALSRAIKELPRELRGAIWDEYFKVVKR